MLSKIKTLSNIKATKEFTDRDESKKIFLKAFDDYKNKKKKLNILVYYGIGGIGKTSLLKELKNYAIEENKKTHLNITIVNINLDISAFKNPADYLLNIYAQLKICSKEFEYAMSRYFLITKRPISDLKNYKFNENSILFDIVGFIAQLFGIFAPVKLSYKLLSWGKESLYVRLGGNKKFINEINALTEKELEKKLPYYLGKTIENNYHNQYFIFFIDSIDKLIDKNSPEDEWLRELIGSAENGLYVIAGREYLKWADLNGEWSGFLEQHILGGLSETDVDYFLSRVPINDVLIKKAIIDVSQGLPLYLDLCVGIYMSLEQEGKNISPENFKLAQNDVIRNFMNYLDKDEAEALKIMASLEQFDIELFLKFAKELNINIPYTCFNDFCEASFAIAIDEQNKIFKIHDTIRSFLNREIEKETAYKIFSTLIEYSKELYYENQKNRTNWIYQQSLTFLQKFGISDIKPGHVTIIVEIGHKLIFEGYGKDVGKGINNLGSEIISSNNFLNFLYATCLFMGEDLEKALSIFKSLNDKGMGEWKYHNLFYIGFCNQLLGNYDTSLDIYRELSGISITNNNDAEIKDRSFERISVILSLKGNFKDSLNNMGNIQNLNQDEKLRKLMLEGDIYCYNFDFFNAKKYFMEALQVCKSINSLYNKENVVLNCMAESLRFTNQSRSLKFSKYAIERSKQLNEPIQMNRGLISQSIALAFSDPDLGIEIAKRAIESNKNIGYKSGILLASEALGLNLIAKNCKDEALRVLENINDLINELNGIFSFTPILISYILFPEKINDFEKKAQWNDFNFTKLIIKKIAENFIINKK
ncbi:MAG: hypothetical protein M0016_00910 [Deltaproteobacteria bacterium]|jgi:hypothetical protein|nr:hypothetical protein [Deltaproteobacteria bacterium]MCL5880906.1 hypothetical protein [Deltaproteobacteria bacterium]MDA8303712.1 hypothetical protein [Deltaproteobacteria bacterium]